MVVVADTSPLNYLVLIGEIGLLPKLYRRVVVPQAVMDELKHPGAPEPVTEFAANPPDWLETAATEMPTAGSITGIMADLDAGEIAAITLAASHPDSLLLMDEIAGRAEASRLGIRSTGTLGILRDAANAGFVELSSAFQKLQTTTFRLPASVIAELLAEDALRKGRLRD